MGPLAHSARPDRGIPAQLYAHHVARVVEGAVTNADAVTTYSSCFLGLLRSACRLAGEFHDLGKLDPANQQVLAGTSGRPLPLNHVDAGVAHLLEEAGTDPARILAALVVYAHHQGLPSIPTEAQKCSDCFRDCARQPDGRPFRQLTDDRLSAYLALHRSAILGLSPVTGTAAAGLCPPLLQRIALSCLADADHADTARHYGGRSVPPGVALRAAKRLAALDTYVAALAAGRSDARTGLRGAVYAACREATTDFPLVECDSPVGSGKTTAVMAHLLGVAQTRGLRRVFVVLPFTNIIDQSVDVYRRSLLLDGEAPEDVVAAHHHRAEYADPAARHLAASWGAPVVVTTAVQFFETLAGRHPAALRKLHQVPGSAIFLDESHACLPTSLWPQAWEWLIQLAHDWGCHVVLGSGSLNRLWHLPEFTRAPRDLPRLVPPQVQARATGAEVQRIGYKSRPDSLTLEQLSDWVMELEGPRLLIVNTVQTAAALARHLAAQEGRKRAEHLSTALTPRDRTRTLKRVKDRLQNAADRGWTLVATSCVEAGVDVSFRTGLRERASLASLIQTGGRVNRSGEHASAEVWDFRLRTIGLVRENPGYRDSAAVLGQLFNEGKVSPDFCTEALRREVRMTGQADLNRHLRKAEEARDFPEVERLFRVIDHPTVTAVVDGLLQAQLDGGAVVDWRELQQLSVQIYSSKVIDFALRDFVHFPGLKAWTLGYDDFLGYMAGVLPLADAAGVGFIV